MDGARWASVTTLQQGNFHTLGHTGAEAGAANARQYELRSGPCVDAVLDDSVLVPGASPTTAAGPSTGPGPPTRRASPAPCPAG